MGRALSVVSPKLAELHDRYELAMHNAEAAAGEAAAQQSMYWYSLWVIHRDKLYPGKGYLSEEEWLRKELLSDAWAPSRATYKGVITAITDWQALGASEEGVMRLLGNRKVAIEGDIRNWFVPGSDRELRPEVRMMLAARGETPGQALTRISELPPDQARAAAGEVVDREYWMVEQDSITYLKGADKLSCILRHEHTRTGLLGRYQLIVACRRIEPEPTRADPGDEIPFEVRSWLMSRFGQHYP